MSYGKNKERKHWEKRAMPLSVGTLTQSKRDALFAIREQVLTLMRTMAATAFIQEPLDETVSDHALDERLLEVQRNCAGLNSVWREQARMRVKPALEQVSQRYFRKLVGRLRYVDQLRPVDETPKHAPKTETAGPKAPPLSKYLNIPLEIEAAITPAEIAELKALAASGEAVNAFGAARRGDDIGLSRNQVAVLLFIHAQVQEKHTPPEFGLKDNFTLQLHIDPRMVPTHQKAEPLDLMQGVAWLLKDDANRCYFRFLDISGASPRSERIRLPLALPKAMAGRMRTSDSGWASLILELSEDTVGVRLLSGKPKPELPAQVTRFVGRDFGYTNTIALSVLEAPVAVDLDVLRATMNGLNTGQKAKDHLLGHILPESVVVLERHLFSGIPFLARVNQLCEGIDGYKSRIDLAYHDLEAPQGGSGQGTGSGPAGPYPAGAQEGLAPGQGVLWPARADQ